MRPSNAVTCATEIRLRRSATNKAFATSSGQMPGAIPSAPAARRSNIPSVNGVDSSSKHHATHTKTMYQCAGGAAHKFAILIELVVGNPYPRYHPHPYQSQSRWSPQPSTVLTYLRVTLCFTVALLAANVLLPLYFAVMECVAAGSEVVE
jgi:hypothetical protein